MQMSLKINDYVKVKGEGRGIVKRIHHNDRVTVEITKKVYPMGVNYYQDGFYTTEFKYGTTIATTDVYKLQDLEKLEQGITLDDIEQL